MLDLEKVIDFIEEKAPVGFEIEKDGEVYICTVYFENARNIGYSLQFECQNSNELMSRLQERREAWLWDGVLEFLEAYGEHLDYWDKSRYLEAISNTYKAIGEALHDLEFFKEGK